MLRMYSKVVDSFQILGASPLLFVFGNIFSNRVTTGTSKANTSSNNKAGFDISILFELHIF